MTNGGNWQVRKRRKRLANTFQLAYSIDFLDMRRQGAKNAAGENRNVSRSEQLLHQAAHTLRWLLCGLA